MPTTAETLAHVVVLYEGHTDKQGEPYWEHCWRVYKRVQNYPSILFNSVLANCALLHDVIEDELLSRDTLCSLGYTSEEISIIEHLSRAKGESYSAYIERLVQSNNRAVVLIKLADLTDNLDPARGPILESQRLRYFEAQARLLRYLMPASPP